MTALGVKAQVTRICFTVIAKYVTMDALNQDNQKAAIAEISKQNPKICKAVEILRIE